MKLKLDRTIVALVLVSLIGIGEALVVGSIIISSNADIKMIQSDIKAEEARRESFNKLIQRYGQIEDEGIIREINDLLPNAENFLEVIEEIEQLAQTAGTTLVVSLGEARLTTDGFELPEDVRNASVIGRMLPPDANYDFLEVDITVRGDYKEFEQFLNLFQDSKYYMNVTSLTVNRISVNDSRFIDASMTTEIFVQQVVFN